MRDEIKRKEKELVTLDDEKKVKVKSLQEYELNRDVMLATYESLQKELGQDLTEQLSLAEQHQVYINYIIFYVPIN